MTTNNIHLTEISQALAEDKTGTFRKKLCDKIATFLQQLQTIEVAHKDVPSLTRLKTSLHYANNILTLER